MTKWVQTNKLDKVKSDYLKCTEQFVAYQKKCNAEKKPFSDHEKLEAMTTAVTNMAVVLGSQKTLAIDRYQILQLEQSRPRPKPQKPCTEKQPKNSVHMSMLMTLEAPVRTKRDASELLAVFINL